MEKVLNKIYIDLILNSFKLGTIPWFNQPTLASCPLMSSHT